jgi:hypothetical protein
VDGTTGAAGDVRQATGRVLESIGGSLRHGYHVQLSGYVITRNTESRRLNPASSSSLPKALPNLLTVSFSWRRSPTRDPVKDVQVELTQSYKPNYYRSSGLTITLSRITVYVYGECCYMLPHTLNP